MMTDMASASRARTLLVLACMRCIRLLLPLPLLERFRQLGIVFDNAEPELRGYDELRNSEASA